VSNRIFSTFVCDPIEDGPGSTKRFMHEDLTLRCDSPEYGDVFDLALVLVLIFSVGIPVAYLLLLWVSRDTPLTEKKSSLSRATAFL